MESDTSVPEVPVEAARLAKPLELQEIQPLDSEGATEMPTTKVLEASKVPTAAWHANMKADLDAYGTANMKISCISEPAVPLDVKCC